MYTLHALGSFGTPVAPVDPRVTTANDGDLARPALVPPTTPFDLRSAGSAKDHIVTVIVAVFALIRLVVSAETAQ